MKKINIKLLITLSAIFTMLALDNVQAQNGPPPGVTQRQQEKVGYGKISGTILDENQEPVPYAAISIVDQKSNRIVDGTVADDKGSFVIRDIVEGTYTLSVTFIGFQTLEKGPFEITGKGESYDVGTLNITSVSTQLDEVVVEGERELIEDKVDRIVYNADQDKTTMGGDATDVLRRVPLLTVDLDGNVSLRGSSNIKVLIDGRPSTITASSIADALKQIPADQIKTVEVITSPSARYDAEGTGGIINIITKKNDLQGGSLSVNSSAGLRGSSLGLNASYRTGRLGLSLGGYGRAGYNVVGEFENEQTTKDEFGSIVSTTSQFADTRNNYLFGRYNFGADYAFNKYNWVGASVNLGIRNFSSNQDGRLTQTNNSMGLRSSTEDVGIDNLGNQVDVSLNYLRTFEEKGKEISLLTLYSQNKQTNDFDIATLQSSEPIDNAFIRNNNDSYNKEFTIQLDYVEPINDKIIVEMGAKNIMRDVTSDFLYLVGDDENSLTPVEGVNLSNNFDYVQNVLAGYLSGTFDLGKGYTLMAGGRYEYTTIAANFSDEADLEIPDYGTFVPSINFSKKLTPLKTVKFAYNRRIQRPSLRFLNPNIDASNPLNISQGNPTLDPEFTDNFEVSYSTFKKGTSINISAFWRNTTGSIQQVRETIGQDTIFSTFQNIGQEDALGVSIFANGKIGKLQLSGGIDSYYAMLDNNLEDPLFNASNEGFVVSGRLFGSYELTEQWALQFFGFIRGRQVQLQGYQTGYYVYSLSLNRMFKEKRGSVGIGAENFLNNGMKMTSEVTTPFVDQFNTNIMRNMNFKVNFSYRIGKLTTGQTRRRQRKVENNDLKDGGGNQDMMNN
ncbi:TonB-dependent receptor domain-containing protein [Fulvivirga sedimenti]|uniref:TonB-dependent receptor n=1 Tax=Fulvivirga sedimenti TaxID=2879465 RepID=A0A9X1HS83_9BACT|nr:outer membrane beta-barrel family protein [Fulvivirga sedimenti]MCA6074675.1 TonB-dependent receptor [Fulvivirga sedimenti]MCA6075852.1 TonB-dependent receptor [Fulvivirga sedimenti]MCA6076980.1 TonB-dependent receptor [Fulvivirga sedimenti]